MYFGIIIFRKKKGFMRSGRGGERIEKTQQQQQQQQQQTQTEMMFNM